LSASIRRGKCFLRQPARRRAIELRRFARVSERFHATITHRNTTRNQVSDCVDKSFAVFCPIRIYQTDRVTKLGYGGVLRLIWRRVRRLSVLVECSSSNDVNSPTQYQSPSRTLSASYSWLNQPDLSVYVCTNAPPITSSPANRAAASICVLASDWSAPVTGLDPVSAGRFSQNASRVSANSPDLERINVYLDRIWAGFFSPAVTFRPPCKAWTPLVLIIMTESCDNAEALCLFWRPSISWSRCAG